MAEPGVVPVHLEVSDTYALSGVAEQGGTVHSGGVFRLSGVMNGRLLVEPGGSANISGVLNGDLDNHGRVLVSGVHDGRIVGNAGEILARVGSVFTVHGRRGVVQADGSLGDLSQHSSRVITDSTPLCRWVDDHFEPVAS